MATAAHSSSSSSSATANTHSPRSRRNARGHAHPHSPRPESNTAPPSAADAVPAPELCESPAVEAGPSSSVGLSDGSAAAESSDQQGSVGNAAAAREKKSAWNKPSNGSIEGGGPVMGAVSWPALSDAAKASTRSLSTESLIALSDGSASVPVVPGPVVANALPKPIASNLTPNSPSNHASPTRQKSMKRGGGGGSGSGSSSSGPLANGGSVPPSPPAASTEVPQIASDRPVAAELSPREFSNRNNGSWENGQRSGGLSPQTHGGNENHRPYGSHRRGNNGGGGDGHHHNSYAARRNQDRGGYEWNSHRNFSGRDVPPMQHHHQQRPPQRPFILPPVPGPAPFISPPAVRPFPNPMGFHDMSGPMIYVPAPPPLPESFRGMPFVAPPMLFPAPDPQLHAALLQQIEYYFSSENLCKDIFLRQNMDEEGWVSVALIANFNRVKKLTTNIHFILDTVQASSAVEVKGDKIRRRNDWMNWKLPSAANQSGAGSSSQPSTQPITDTLAARMRSVGLEQATTTQMAHVQPELAISRSSSGELNSDGIGNGTGQVGSDQPSSTRSLGTNKTS